MKSQLSFALSLVLLGCSAEAATDAWPSPAQSENEPRGWSEKDLSKIVVAPMLTTKWGQSGRYQAATPLKDGAATYPGCTTLASAQILNYYRFQNRANKPVSYNLEYAPLSGPDVNPAGNTIALDLSKVEYDFSLFADDLNQATTLERRAVATFIYHVGLTMNAQFGGGEGSSATAKQIENAFRYQWGYSSKSRRSMSIIGKNAFQYSDLQWADLIRAELDAGRPVLYMAQQADADAGHAFVIDGYNTEGLVHVNFGWGGRANGWYDPNVLEDHVGRRWNREPMIFLGLEPSDGFARTIQPREAPKLVHTWNGTGSVIGLATATTKGYGMTFDEAQLHASREASPVVFFQWEIDARDGTRLEISAGVATRANITYGAWSTRARDRIYRDVALPFVLDPTRDGLGVQDGEYYVIAVASSDNRDATITATATNVAATALESVAAEPISVDGSTWNGNGSLISMGSGTATGYGLTQDEVKIHPNSAQNPVVFFQWEIDGRDGRKLKIAAEGMETATIRAGTWNDRSADVVQRVSLPYTFDPALLGLVSADGEYLTLSVAFDRKPAVETTVTVEVVR